MAVAASKALEVVSVQLCLVDSSRSWPAPFADVRSSWKQSNTSVNRSGWPLSWRLCFEYNSARLLPHMPKRRPCLPRGWLIRAVVSERHLATFKLPITVVVLELGLFYLRGCLFSGQPFGMFFTRVLSGGFHQGGEHCLSL